jgi:hypothetical protein
VAPVAAIAQSVEHVIRNDGVTGSNPVCGTIFSDLLSIWRVPRFVARYVAFSFFAEALPRFIEGI